LNLGLLPNFLGQKYPARAFTVETLLDFSGGCEGDFAGLAVVGGKGHAALGLAVKGAGCEWVTIVDGQAECIGRATPTPVRLAVQVRPDGSFSFSFAVAAGAWAELPRIFSASEGGWLGAKVGLFALHLNESGAAGFADFDYFRFGA
jgi:hypothetical protein